jgi:hypothetical protein
MDMRFGTWNLRSLYRVSSLITVSEEILQYRFDLMGVQELRRNRRSTEPPGQCNFSMERGMSIMDSFIYIGELYQQLRG